MRVEVVAAVIRKHGTILITKRPGKVHLSGLWEFPGGKVEPDESLEIALQREIVEEIGVEIRIDGEFSTLDYDYPDKSVRLHFFNCTIVHGEPRPLAVADLLWVKPEELGKYPFPPADALLIRTLSSKVSSSAPEVNAAKPV